MKLKNKIILIISPQAWGNMYLAKHHYALELARSGNEVYFMNLRQKEKVENWIQIVESSVHPSLHLVHHSLPFPYKIKFKWIGLYHFLVRFHIKKVEKKIGKKLDIVWSFDIGNCFPFKFFSQNPIKLYSPLDIPSNQMGLNSAKGADIIISITKEILEKFKEFDIPKYLVHHGLANEFINPPKLDFVKDDTKRIGIAGNLLRTDIDKKCLLQIIEENPNVIFEFWGSYQKINSNIGGGTDADAEQFISKLQSSSNVKLHGTVHPTELAMAYQRMDGFLICYDILKDQSKGVNYHKVMEYLSTGKVVVSSNITTYENLPNLVVMNAERDNNNNLPMLFTKVIESLEYHNSKELQAIRIKFAQDNSYSNNIKIIEQILDKEQNV